MIKTIHSSIDVDMNLMEYVIVQYKYYINIYKLCRMFLYFLRIKKTAKIFFTLFKALLKYLTTAKSDSLFYVISRYTPTRLGMSGTAW